MGHSPWFGQYYKYFPVGAEKTRFREFAIGRAQLRMKQGSMTKDVFHHFVSLDLFRGYRFSNREFLQLNESGTDDAHAPSLTEVTSDSSLVIVAGSDTTSTVLSSLFWFLMCNPNIYRRLQDEVDSVFPPGENALDPSKHIHMNYLNAVM